MKEPQLPHPPFPAQTQRPHGKETQMSPRPVAVDPEHRSSGKLRKRVAIVTGGDSGIGRAVSILFAQEGADVCIVYLDAHEDAAQTLEEIQKTGQKGIKIAGDIGDESFCQAVVNQVIQEFGRVHILINNAAEQQVQENIENISKDQLERTFKTNIFSFFYLTKAVLPHLKKGAAIVNTTSVTAYKGSPHLLDYSATKGAIVAFTRSLSLNLIKKGIRVNAVAPGPIWTPLIVSSMPPSKSSQFGADTPMARPGQPEEVAACFLFLASDDASYISGQVLHPNGGEIING
jgi:NAD(P)-dependent dehydrogenase (short-subunit alcohol dehydrogenase family)